MAQRLSRRIIECIDANNFKANNAIFEVFQLLSPNATDAFQDVILTILQSLTAFFRTPQPWTLSYRICCRKKFGTFVQLSLPDKQKTFTLTTLLRQWLDESLDEKVTHTKDCNQDNDQSVDLGQVLVLFVDRKGTNRSIQTSQYLSYRTTPYILRAVLTYKPDEDMYETFYRSGEGGDSFVSSTTMLKKDRFDLLQVESKVVAWIFDAARLSEARNVKVCGIPINHLGLADKKRDYCIQSGLQFLLACPLVVRKINECEGNNLLGLSESNSNSIVSQLKNLTFVHFNKEKNIIVLKGRFQQQQDVDITFSLSRNTADNSSGIESNIYALGDNIRSIHVLKSLSVGFCKERDIYALSNSFNPGGGYEQLTTTWQQIKNSDIYANYAFFVITPTMIGQNLLQWKESDFTLVQWNHVVIQLAQGLSALEQQDIMHHNMDLENIFVERLSTKTRFEYHYPFRFDLVTDIKVIILRFDRAYCGSCLLRNNNSLETKKLCDNLGLCNEFIPKLDWYKALQQLYQSFTILRPMILTIAPLQIMSLPQQDCLKGAFCKWNEEQLAQTKSIVDFLQESVTPLPELEKSEFENMDAMKLDISRLVTKSLKSGSKTSCIVDAVYKSREVFLRILTSQHQHFLTRFMINRKIGLENILYPFEFGQCQISDLEQRLKFSTVELKLSGSRPTAYYQLIEKPSSNLILLSHFCETMSSAESDDRWAWDIFFQIAQVLSEFEQLGIMHNQLNGDTVFIEVVPTTSFAPIDFQKFRCESKYRVKIIGFDFSACATCFQDDSPFDVDLSDVCVKSGICGSFQKNLDFNRFAANFLEKTPLLSRLKQQFPHVKEFLQSESAGMFACTCAANCGNKCVLDTTLINSCRSPDEFIQLYTDTFAGTCYVKQTQRNINRSTKLTKREVKMEGIKVEKIEEAKVKKEGVVLKKEQVSMPELEPRLNEDDESNCKLQRCKGLTKKNTQCKLCVTIPGKTTCTIHSR